MESKELQNKEVTHSNMDSPTKVLIWVVVLSGIGLLYLGLILEPVGHISESVLFAVGELLTFAGSIIGSNYYWGGKFRELKAELKRQSK